MKKATILAFLVILSSQIFSNDNVNFRRAVPDFTIVSGMKSPIAFSIDKKSNFYFLDNDSKRISIYDFNSNLIREIGLANFENPVGISVSTNDNIYVLDREATRIVSLSENGAVEDVFGNEGDLEIGKLLDPFYMTIDEYDNLYILDSRQGLLKYSSEGLFRGKVSISDPIALAIDREQRIHLLRREGNNGFLVTILSENFQFDSEIKISNLFNPVDIVVNYFGEYYIVDKEQGKVFRYGNLGNIIGEPIGKKSTSKGRGQFGEPVRLQYKYVNNEVAEIFVMDSKFAQAQSFEVTTLHEREKLAEVKPFLPIRFSSSANDIVFEKFFYSDGYEFYCRKDNSILVRKDGKELYVLSGVSFDEIISIQVTNDKIFIADTGNDKVYIHDLNNGASLGNIFERLDDIVGMSVDSQGNIYVGLKNDVLIFNNSGNRLSSISEIHKSDLSNISSITMAGDDLLYIHLDDNQYYYTFSFSQNIYTQNKIGYKNFGRPKIVWGGAPGELLFIYNKESGEVYVFEEGILIDQFMSKGNGKMQMPEITGLFVDSESSKLVLSGSNNTVKMFDLSLPSIYNLRLDIDELGFAKLIWDADKNNSAIYLIYRRQNTGQAFQKIGETRETSYTIMEEVNGVYEYAIRISVLGKSEGQFSNSVQDYLTYARTIRYTKPEEAIDYLIQLRDLNRNVIDNQILSIYREIVNKYKLDEKYELALKNLTRMKSLQPNNFAIYLERGDVLEKLHRYDEALEELETAKSKFPNNVNIYYHLLRLHKLQNDYRKVIAVANEALTLFSNDEQILENLADAYYNLKIFNESARYYKVLYQQTGNSNYSIQAGRILVAQKKYDEAFSVYEQVKTSGKATGVLYAALAEAYMGKGEDNNAIQQINQGLQIEPKNAQLYFLLGKVHEQKGDLTSARTAYEKAIEFDDTRAEYNLAIADLLYKKNAKSEATYYYETAVLYSPDNVDALLKLGSIYLEENKVDYAYRHLVKASQLAPNNAEVMTKYTECKDKRKTLNATREPIEYNYIDLKSVNLGKLDSFNPSNFGTVTIFNTRNESISDILLEITCPELIDLPVLLTVPLLQPNEFLENYFDLKITEELADKIPSSRKEVSIKFTLSYPFEGSKKSFTKNEKITITR